MKLITVILLSILQVSYQRSTPDSDSYTAIVVEYGPEDPASPDVSPVLRNGDIYASYIQKAGQQSADIIVFPEDGLTSVNLPSRHKMGSWSTLVPLNYTPCNQTKILVSEVLSTISCVAKDAQIYVVINIAEKVPCETRNCPKDKVLYFNSQVIFDREGKIIAKYRKTHLFSEPQFNVTPEPEIVTFQTDFGVTFGTFICFDILFKEPTLTLTRKLNITDIIYSTAWFSELPFLTAIQTQYGWSYAENVNLIASGYNRVKFGNAGSGIYFGRDTINCQNVIMQAGNRFTACEVPKKNRNVNSTFINEVLTKLSENRRNTEQKHVHDELRKRETMDIMLFNDNLTSYKSIPLNTSLQQTLCDGDFCCDFDIEMSSIDPNSIYKIVTFNGVRTFPAQSVTVGIQSCAVVQCGNDTITSCGIRFNSETTFDSIKINATFMDYENTIIIPSSIDVNLLPLSNWMYTEYFEDKKVHIRAYLKTTPVRDVLTCGLYARIFSRDKLKPSTRVSALQIATIVALIAISIFFVFLYRKGWRIPIRRSSQAEEPYHSLQAASK